MDNSKKATLELGTKPVGKLLMQYALPAIAAMTAASLYNMTDSIFIGQGCGALAISGLAITFPLQNLGAAFGAGVGVGASTCISVKLGQKDYDTAERVFGNAVTLNVIIGVAFSIITLLFLNPILRFFGASDSTLPYAREYMVITLAGNAISHMFFGMNAILRAASKPRSAMMASIMTVILNAILSPIFIWPLHMGIGGAALATIIAQAAVLTWQLRIFSNKQCIVHFKRGIYRPVGRIIKNIIGIGMSPFAMNVCSCIVIIFINNALTLHGGDLAVGAFGITNKIAFIFIMINMGMNQGMFPIAGYNYGARNYDRLLKVLKYTMSVTVSIATLGFVVGQIFPYECARLFTTDDTLIRIAEHAIRVNMLAFPVVGLQMVCTGFFQSIGKAKVSMLLSLSRQLLFFLPLLIVLPKFYQVDGVWFSQPISDFISAIVAVTMLLSYIRKLKAEHDKNLQKQAITNQQNAITNQKTDYDN